MALLPSEYTQSARPSTSKIRTFISKLHTALHVKNTTGTAGLTQMLSIGATALAKADALHSAGLTLTPPAGTASTTYKSSTLSEWAILDREIDLMAGVISADAKNAIADDIDVCLVKLGWT